MFRTALIAIALSAALAAPAAGQGHGGAAAGAAAGGPFEVRAYGAFRAMMHGKDFGAKTTIGAALAADATEGVGAVAGLRGEITIVDGAAVVTYGGAGCAPACPPPGTEAAAPLATSRVAGWREAAATPGDLAGAALEAFVIAQAKAARLDLDKPFPVRLVGRLIDVKMHVLEAPDPAFAGHGGGHAMAKQDDIAAASLDGMATGVYAPAALQGVVSHPGEAFHWHWVDPARRRTAHLDAFGVAAGSRLLLPSRH